MSAEIEAKVKEHLGITKAAAPDAPDGAPDEEAPASEE
jgi:hypothetical protein